MPKTEVTILMLHRVGVPCAFHLPANENMKVSPSFLETFVNDARTQGYDFLSMDELTELMAAPEETPPRKAFLLTFDDGYLDNFVLAYPLLKRLAVPFCIYVTTGFINASPVFRPWWYQLEDVILARDALKTPVGESFSLKNAHEKQQAFLTIRARIMANRENHDRYCAWLAVQSAALGETLLEPLFMGWDHIRQLAVDELVTIGAHTLNHPVLSTLDETASFQEVKCSKEILEHQCGREVRHFAYPFGGPVEAGPREWALAQKAGFSTAVATRQDEVRIGCANRFALPRVMLTESKTLRVLQGENFRSKVKNAIKRPFRMLGFYQARQFLRGFQG